MRAQSLLVFLVLFVGFLLVAGARNAYAQSLEIGGAVTAQIDGQPDQDSYSETQATGPIADSASAVVEPSPGGAPAARCDSSAYADFGTLSASLFGETIGGPELSETGNFGGGNAFAFFEDWVTVVAPNQALADTQGTARVRVRVSGLLDADSGGRSMPTSTPTTTCSCALPDAFASTPTQIAPTA